MFLGLSFKAFGYPLWGLFATEKSIFEDEVSVVPAGSRVSLASCVLLGLSFRSFGYPLWLSWLSFSKGVIIFSWLWVLSWRSSLFLGLAWKLGGVLSWRSGLLFLLSPLDFCASLVVVSLLNILHTQPKNGVSPQSSGSLAFFHFLCTMSSFVVKTTLDGQESFPIELEVGVLEVAGSPLF